MGAVKEVLIDLAEKATPDVEERLMRGSILHHSDILQILRSPKAQEMLKDGSLWDFISPCLAEILVGSGQSVPVNSDFYKQVFNPDPSEFNARLVGLWPVAQLPVRGMLSRAAELHHATDTVFETHEAIWRSHGLRVARVLRDKAPRTKLWFKKGDLVLAKKVEFLVPCYEDPVIAYSMLMRQNCIIENRLLRWQE